MFDVYAYKVNVLLSFRCCVKCICTHCVCDVESVCVVLDVYVQKVYVMLIFFVLC